MQLLISQESLHLLENRDRIARPLLIFEYFADWGTYRLYLMGLGDAVRVIKAFLGPTEDNLAGTHYMITDRNALLIRHHTGSFPPARLIQMVRCQICGLRLSCLFVCPSAAGINICPRFHV